MHEGRVELLYPFGKTSIGRLAQARGFAAGIALFMFGRTRSESGEQSPHSKDGRAS